MLSGRWSVRSFVSADIPRAKELANSGGGNPDVHPDASGGSERGRGERLHTLPLRICKSTSTTRDERQRWRRCVSSRPSVRSVLRSLPLCGTEQRCVRSLTNAPQACLSRSLSRFPSSLSTLPPTTLFFPLSLAHGSPKYELPELGRTREKPTLGLALRTHAPTLYTYARPFCTAGSRAHFDAYESHTRKINSLIINGGGNASVYAAVSAALECARRHQIGDLLHQVTRALLVLSSLL